MEFQITALTKKSFSMVTVSHANELPLLFSAGGYATARPGAVKPDPDSPTGVRIALFEEINEYLAKLPMEKQDSLYDIYSRIDSIYNTYGQIRNPSNGSGDMLSMLSKLTQKIYEIVRFDDLREYIVSNRSLKLPPELSDVYLTADKITPLYMDRTYRLQEYIDLVAIAMGVRFMIPIWGAYLPIVGDETSTNMKEYHAFKILQGSKLHANPAFFRLETYIRANLDEGDLDMSLLFSFLSSDEVPIYLMALTVIRKLAVAPLSAETSSDHLMKITHNYATGNAVRLPGAFGGNIRRKTDPDAASNEDNSSVLDVYKMKEAMSIGDLSINEVYIERYQNAASAIAADIDPEMVERFVQYALGIDDIDPRGCQMALVTWVASTIVPATVIDLFDREHLLISMGICQAVLNHWGFAQLAILVTAKPIPVEEDVNVPEPPRAPISKINQEKLNVINPYPLPPGPRNEPVQSSNPAIRGIMLVSSDLFKNDWVPRCLPELAAQCDRSDITRRLEVSAGVRDELARLHIKLDEHNR